jgi:hypothetical protein
VEIFAENMCENFEWENDAFDSFKSINFLAGKRGVATIKKLSKVGWCNPIPRDGIVFLLFGNEATRRRVSDSVKGCFSIPSVRHHIKPCGHSDSPRPVAPPGKGQSEKCWVEF